MKRAALCVLLFAVAAVFAADQPPVGDAGSGQPLPKSFDGVVLAFRTSMVNAKTAGNVSRISVEEGQKVAERQILAQMDDTLARASSDLARLQAEDTSDIRNAELQLAQAERDVERVMKMDKSASAAEIQRAEYVRDVSVVVLAGKQQEHKRLEAVAAARLAALEDYVVRSPFDGIVAQKLIEVGETTAPIERRLFQIIDISKVYIDVHPEIAHVKDLAVGDRAEILTEILPDKAFSGKVTFISPSIDPGSRYFGVKVLVENPDGLLRPGLKARVVFPDKISSAAAGPAKQPLSPAADGSAAPAGTSQ